MVQVWALDPGRVLEQVWVLDQELVLARARAVGQGRVEVGGFWVDA